MRVPLGCTILLLGLPALVTAQANVGRMANDAYTRSHDYDLVHQRIEVRNFDWDSTSLDGRGLTFIEPEGREHRPQQIWSQGEDHDNHFWFPTYDFPNDLLFSDTAAT